MTSRFPQPFPRTSQMGPARCERTRGSLLPGPGSSTASSVGRKLARSVSKGNPQESRHAFDGAWLRTGDVLKIDEDGYLWITGRKKELINFKGNQVPPAEIEAVLLSHPLVDDEGVCGLVDTALGTEVPAACVVLAASVRNKGTGKALHEIETFVNERVAPYKKLRGGIFSVGLLPKGSTGSLERTCRHSSVVSKIPSQSCEQTDWAMSPTVFFYYEVPYHKTIALRQSWVANVKCLTIICHEALGSASY
jgi:hypothetical protein